MKTLLFSVIGLLAYSLHCIASNTTLIPPFQLEDELERRKELGFRYLQVLRRQNQLLIGDEDARETHQVNFMAIVREISRLLKQYNKQRQNEDESDSYEEEFDENLQHK